MISRSEAFRVWYACYEETGGLGCVRLGAMREEVRGWFGEPDRVSVVVSKRPLAGIWRFGTVEFHFSDGGTLFLVFTEEPDGGSRVIISE